MKIVYATVLMLLCAGCVNKQTSDLQDSVFNELYVYHDKGTGCQYVSDGRGITPRMDADGKQVCKKVAP